MIVDCHTQIWSDDKQLGPGALAHIEREAGRRDVSASPADHALAAKCTDKTLILGFRSLHLDAEIPNELIAEHVGRKADRMVGVAGIDPTDEAALDVAAELLDSAAFRGLTISPSSQNVHPADSRAMALYELAAERRVPMFFNQGTHFQSAGRMEYARPSLLDEIAREYPTMPIVISSLGHPWIEEGIALMGKHARVYGSIAGLIRRPWQAYNALVLVHQYHVMDKVLFGSGFPYLSAARAIETVYRLHEVTQGTNLPSVPRETLRSMVERDALTALGIARPGEAPKKPKTLYDDDDF
jgi:hypothetical protein